MQVFYVVYCNVYQCYNNEIKSVKVIINFNYNFIVNNSIFLYEFK